MSSIRPLASTTAVAARMAMQATRDTSPERALRRELHARGLRYRVHLRPEPALRVTVDIAFTRARLAVFVDGCFWHRCPEHGTLPRANAHWWLDKLNTNVARDRRTDTALTQRGWTVIRVWEHTPPEHGADLIANELKGLPLFRTGTAASDAAAKPR
jgi:DNA mismatch endonuclease (patch repair protein)